MTRSTSALHAGSYRRGRSNRSARLRSPRSSSRHLRVRIRRRVAGAGGTPVRPSSGEPRLQFGVLPPCLLFRGAELVGAGREGVTFRSHMADRGIRGRAKIAKLGRYEVVERARQGRDGRRLPRQGPRHRPARRDQDDPRPPATTSDRVTVSSGSASSARRRPPGSSRTRTSSRSTTSARTPRPGRPSSRWSTSRGKNLKTLLAEKTKFTSGRDRGHDRPDRARRSTTPTARGSSTATSSRRTSSSRPTAR